jgi:hypothetical protein
LELRFRGLLLGFRCFLFERRKGKCFVALAQLVVLFRVGLDQPFVGFGLSRFPVGLPQFLLERRAKLMGTPTARGPFAAFLPSRPLKWGFRMFFRSNFPAFRPQSTRTKNSEHPSFIDFGLASSPKSQLLKIAKTQKP